MSDQDLSHELPKTLSVSDGGSKWCVLMRKIYIPSQLTSLQCKR
jgi:hypothetical protein